MRERTRQLGIRRSGGSYYRSYLALLLAAVVGSIAFTVAMATVQGFEGYNPFLLMIGGPLTYFVLGAGPATLFIGLPVFLRYRERLRPTAILCTGLGAVIGSVPALVWGLIWSPMLIGGSLIGGAAGGLVFWWVAHDEIERNQSRRV